MQKIKAKVNDVLSAIKEKFSGLGAPYKLKKSNKKRLTKVEKAEARLQQRRAILGVGLFLVVVSIAYSTSVILIGVDSIESKIALVPQVVFAAITSLIAFSKLYK